MTSEPLSGEVSEGRLAMSHVSDQYPGRQISLIAWGNADGWLDRILVTTTGDIPDLDSDEEGAGSTTDPTMHPDHQVALSGVLYLFTYPGMVVLVLPVPCAALSGTYLAGPFGGFTVQCATEIPLP